MELVWTPEAVQDRDHIYDYIESENPMAALVLDELFSEKAQWLTNHPEGGRLGRVPETKELIVHPNYMLVYEVVGKQVRVLNLVHTAHQWPPAQNLAITG